MSGLALSVNLAGGAATLADARAMGGAAPYRAAAGMREATLGAAAAVYLDGREEPRLAPSAPLVSSSDSILLVADVRIDNRDDIAARLNVAAYAAAYDDVALVLEAYRRWGRAFADSLSGDFSVAIWDARQSRLVAARSASALRPLVYRIEPGRLLVASDVSQILALAGMPRRVCERQLAAFIAGLPGIDECTAYDGIHRLPPGHTMVIEGTRPVLAPHPEVDEGVVFAPADEHAAWLRARMTEAVRARLDVADRTALLLSGGLDSTAIAAYAGTLRRAGSLASDLVAYTFAHDELHQIDERDIASLVAAAFRMRHVAVPGDDAWPLAEYPDHGPDLDAPDRSRSHVLTDRAAALARRDGATTIVTGQRGDALFGGGTVDHLGRLRHEGPAAFWRDVTGHARRARLPRLTVIGRYVAHYAAASLWPSTRLPRAREALRHVMGVGALPPWVPPATIRRFALDEIADEARASRLPGEARRRRHREIRDPYLLLSAESFERKFARAGLRYVDPWADNRLAAWVLRIPQYLLAPAGESKRLFRDSMRGVLPEGIRVSARKRTPGPLYHLRGLSDRSRGVVLSLMNGSRVVARGYVDEGRWRSTYADMVARGAAVTEHEWRSFWRVLDVEDWLRRYHD